MTAAASPPPPQETPSLRRPAAAPPPPRPRGVPVTPFLAVAAACVLLWAALLTTRGDRWQVLSSDQPGYYAYLPSLVLDGDLDFTNQPMPWADFSGPNKWPAGVALAAAPAFLAAHVACLGLDAAGLAGEWARPDGYSTPYLLLVIAWLLVLIAGGVWLGGRLLVERYAVSPRAAALAALAWWLGSNAAWYYVREPLISHPIGAAWTLAAAYFAHRLLPTNPADRPPLTGSAAAFALACSMATATRFTSALIVAPLAAAVVGGLLWRGRWRDVLRALPLALLACGPLVAQWLIWRAMYGAAGDVIAATPGAAVPADQQAVGYGANEVFYWTRPALLRTLLSSRHGLFFFSPILLFSVWGIWHGLRRRGLVRDAVVVGLLLGFLMLWYVNSAWYGWWFGAGFGARAFIEMAPLYVVGLGLAFARIGRLPRKRRTFAVALVAAAFTVNWLLIGLWVAKLVDRNGYLIPWEGRTAVGAWERI